MSWTLAQLAPHFARIPPAALYMVAGGLLGRELPLTQEAAQTPLADHEALLIAFIAEIYCQPGLEPLQHPDSLLLALRHLMAAARKVIELPQAGGHFASLVDGQYFTANQLAGILDLRSGQYHEKGELRPLCLTSVDLGQLWLRTQKELPDAPRPADHPGPPPPDAD